MSKKITKKPENTNEISFNFRKFDMEFPAVLNEDDFKNLFLKLKDISGRKWNEILQDTRHGNSKHHKISSNKIDDKFMSLIKERKLPRDDIFSYSLDKKERLIGEKFMNIFYVIWYDKNHEFSPSNPKK